MSQRIDAVTCRAPDSERRSLVDAPCPLRYGASLLRACDLCTKPSIRFTHKMVFWQMDRNRPASTFNQDVTCAENMSPARSHKRQTLSRISISLTVFLSVSISIFRGGSVEGIRMPRTAHGRVRHYLSTTSAFVPCWTWYEATRNSTSWCKAKRSSRLVARRTTVRGRSEWREPAQWVIGDRSGWGMLLYLDVQRWRPATCWSTGRKRCHNAN
jgi:hypothetical protein